VLYNDSFNSQKPVPVDLQRCGRDHELPTHGQGIIATRNYDHNGQIFFEVR